MTPTRLLPLLIAAAFAALIPLPAAADVFGPVGVVAGQTVRVTAVNREAPGAASCRVELSFRDASGQLFLNGDGQPQVTQLTLAPGAAAAGPSQPVPAVA